VLAGAGTHTAQAEVVVPVLGPVVVPVRGAQVVGRVVERAAADHPLRAGVGPARLFWTRQATLPTAELAADIVAQVQAVQHAPAVQDADGLGEP
jgi:hypothetical protein